MGQPLRDHFHKKCVSIVRIKWNFLSSQMYICGAIEIPLDKLERLVKILELITQKWSSLVLEWLDRLVQI